MIQKIRNLKILDNYVLHVSFEDGKVVSYDVEDDINTIPSFEDLKSIYGLFQQVQLDESRTCVYWTDKIDLPSDAIYEYGIDNK
jgi:hypothetical protein